MATSYEIRRNKTLNRGNIVFPKVEAFAELFTAAQHDKPATITLATVESRDCGEGDDHRRERKTHITGYVRVNDITKDLGAMYVTGLTDALMAYVTGPNVLHVAYDSPYFEIIERGKGRAAVYFQYSQIIGSRLLAIIDFATVPKVYK